MWRSILLLTTIIRLYKWINKEEEEQNTSGHSHFYGQENTVKQNYINSVLSMQYFTHFTIVINSGLRRLNIQTPGHGVHVSLLYWMTGAWWMHYQLPGHGVPSPLFTPIITTTSSSLYPTPPFHLSFINTRPPHPFIPLTGQMLTLAPSLTWPLYDPQNFRIMLHTNVWSK